MLAPAFSLDLTSAILDPRVTFSRALNTATRINSSGLVEVVNADVARFDYDPITLACKGLLVEESRTNIALYSSEMQQASWSKVRVTVSQNATIAPNGALEADLVIPTAVSGTHFINQASGFAAFKDNTVYTSYLFAKAGGYDFVTVGFITKSGGLRECCFNVSNGQVATVGDPISYDIYPMGDGWYLCFITGNSGTGTSAIAGAYHIISNDGALQPSFTGDGTSGVYIWGCQVEEGAFPTSYIPTTTTAVTRNADVATITGTNFSSFWQATRGGVLVRARPGTVSGTRPWLQFDDGTANEIIALRGNTTNPELYIVDGGAPQAQIDAGTIAANTDYSLTGWWATNDCKARLDSGAVVADTSATIPTVTQARLGSDGTNYLNGHLASISYYDSFSEQIYTRRKNKAVFNLM